MSEHDLRIKVGEDELVADDQGRGAVMLQIGTRRGNRDSYNKGMEWNCIRIPRRHVKALVRLLTGKAQP